MCMINEKGRKRGVKCPFIAGFYCTEKCRNTVDMQHSVVGELRKG